MSEQSSLQLGSLECHTKAKTDPHNSSDHEIEVMKSEHEHDEPQPIEQMRTLYNSESATGPSIASEAQPKSSTAGKIEGSNRKAPPYMLPVLCLNISIYIGAIYVFDFPQALEDPLIRYMDTQTLDISLLYSMYALPNIFMAPVSGYIIEHYDMGLVGMWFNWLVFTGHVTTLAALFNRKIGLALIGRALYGLGFGGIIILQATINEFWFSGKMLSVSNALCQVFANLGDLLGNFLTPLLFSRTRSLEYPLFVGGCICVFSCIASVGYYYVHRRYTNLIRNEEEVDRDDEPFAESKELEEYFALVKENPDFKIRFGFSSIKYFNLTFWLLCLIYMFLFNSILQLTNIATDVLTNRFGYEYDQAKYFTVLPQLAFMFSTPIVSKVIETKGKKALSLLFASILSLMNYIAMYYTPFGSSSYLWVNMALLGFINSILTSCIYSSVALTVPKSGVSMAYSILEVFDSIGIAAFPIYFGWLSKARTVAAYDNCFLNLMILSSASIICSMLLYLHDVRQHALLELPENSKRVASVRKSINSDYLKRSFHDSRKSTPKSSHRGSVLGKKNQKKSQLLKDDSDEEN